VPPTQRTTPNAMLNHYQCADGRAFFLVLIKEAQEFERFCVAIERTDLPADPRFTTLSARREHAHELAALLADWFAREPLAHWRARFEAHAITFGDVATIADTVNDPQMSANGVFVEFADDPGRRVVNSPLELRDFPKRAPVSAPALGAHTVEVLSALGYDHERIEQLVAANVVAAG